MKQLLVVGSFGYHNNQLDGQTIKTRQMYQLVKERYSGKVNSFCTMQLKDKPWRIFMFFYLLIRCHYVIALYSSSGGLQTVMPKLYNLTKILSKRLIYVAIGSTQVQLMLGEGLYDGKGKRDDIIECCKNLYVFFSETRKIESELKERLNFKNVDFLPNFRFFDESTPFSPSLSKTLRLVFMARITYEKGIDVIFKFIESIKGKGLDITLDFYGQMDGKCNEEFLKFVNDNKGIGVRFMGYLKPEKIQKTLLNYDVILLPTLFEGIPGTVIDGYISSLPVIATNWLFAEEIIEDEKNGFIVPMENPEKQKQFNSRILQLYNDRELLNKMKKHAYESRMQFSAQTAWDAIYPYL